MPTGTVICTCRRHHRQHVLVLLSLLCCSRHLNDVSLSPGYRCFLLIALSSRSLSRLVIDKNTDRTNVMHLLDKQVSWTFQRAWSI